MVDATPLGPRFHEALVYASGHFSGRRRGNTRVPAIAHAMAVCALVLDLAGAEDEAIAALLHDVVEDRGGQDALDHIEATWGACVANLVRELTDEVEPSGRPWLELKQASLDRMPAETPAALLIALADKADNARTLLRAVDAEGPEIFSQHTAGSAAAVLWYYEALVMAFEARRTDLGEGALPLLQEFSHAVGGLRLRSVEAPDRLGSSA